MESLLDLHLASVEDPVVLPGGEEYQLLVISAEVKPSKSSDRTILQVGFEVVDNPTAKTIFESMAFPTESDEKKTQYMMKLRIKQFLQAIGIDPANPGDPESWKGETGWAFVKAEEYNGEPVNRVSRWIVKK
jgi:hypothetical protein